MIHSANALLLQGALLHADLVNPHPDDPNGPEWGKASPYGLLLIIVLLVAVFLLIRSMNRHIRKLPDTFEREHPEADQQADEGTDKGAAGEAEERPATDDRDAAEDQRGKPPHPASR